MSSLLEQAIVDAQALRDAALKNAEQMVIEKYSEQVKDAVSLLLEQEEDLEGLGLGGDLGGDLGEEPIQEDPEIEKSDKSIVEEVPVSSDPRSKEGIVELGAS